MVSHAARLLNGLPIYTEPSADFVPFFYTPGYPALVAGTGWFLGDVSLLSARIVSLTATLATFGLLFWVVRRETSSLYGLLAVGIYAALFRTSGAFYDLARPDALYIFLIFVGVVLAYRFENWLGVVAASLVFVGAFFTKQTSSVFVPPIILYLMWRDWRHALVFTGLVFGLSALGVWVLNRATDGWFWTYIFEGHQGHLFYWKNILLEYWRDVLFLAPVLLIIPLLWFGYRVPIIGLSLLLCAHWIYAYVFRAQTLDYVPHMYYRELFYESPRWLILVPPALIGLLAVQYRLRNPVGIRIQTPGFWLLMFVAGVGASALNHSTQWAYSNCFMPIALFSACLIPMALRDLMDSGPREAPGAWLLPVALLVQFVAWGYSPGKQVPGDADYTAYAQMEKTIEAIDGKIFMPAHPLYTYHRDGQVHTHQMGIRDVAFMGGLKDLPGRLRKGEWAAVVVDERLSIPGIERGYYVGEHLRYAGKDALRAKTGFLVRPKTIWYRQDKEPRALVSGIAGNFEDGKALGWTATASKTFRPIKGFIRGRQGDYSLKSSKAATGRLRTSSFVLNKRRLKLLMAGQGRAGGIRVLKNGKTVLTRRVRRTRRPQFRRVSLDLSEHLGQAIRLEVFDDDKKGSLWIDDLRLTH